MGGIQMSEKLYGVVKCCLLDIYSIMEQGPYVRTCDEDYFVKFEEFEKKNKQKDIALIEDFRKNSKGEYGVYSWTTYTNMANSIVKFLLLNTNFLKDCGSLAAIQYNAPHTYFNFDVEYDYEQELTRLIKDYFSRDLEDIVYDCHRLFSVVNSQEEINVLSLERIYDFINMYRALVYLFVDFIFTEGDYKGSIFLIGATDHGKNLGWMRNPLNMKYRSEWL